MQNVFGELSVACMTVATGASAYFIFTAMEGRGDKQVHGEQPPLIAALKPALTVFAPLSGWILERIPRLGAWIQIQLTAAGLGHVVAPRDYMSMRFVLAALMAMAGIPLGGFVQAALIGFGLVFPDLWLMSLIQERHAAVRQSMPTVVDLLALCTMAGLEFGSSIDRVLQKIGTGPLREELRLMRRDMALGRSLSGSLMEMARRIRMPEMTSFVAILCQGLDMGAGVAQVLEAQAEKMRLERMEKAERSGAQAQQKILLPLLLLMLPAFACLVFIPLLASQAKAYFAGFGGM